MTTGKVKPKWREDGGVWINADCPFRLFKLLSNPEVQSGFLLEKKEKGGRRRGGREKWENEKERIQTRLRVLSAKA